MYKSILVSVIFFRLTCYCVSRNATIAKHTNKIEISQSGEFDLTQLYALNDTEFEHNYFKIINTMRKMGPESLRFINRTDLLENAFVTGESENSEELRIRWESCCDHFKLNGTQKQFKEFVMQRVYKPPTGEKPPKKPPTHERTLLETEDAVDAKKKKK